MIENQFKIKKVSVTDEEKREIAAYYLEKHSIPVDLDAYLKMEVYNGFLEMKCVKCDYFEDVDLDIIRDLYELGDDPYPVLSCDKCGHKRKSGYLVPLEIYNSKKN